MNKSKKENSDNKTVIVLGNPRSGTSTVAGILNILGVNMNGDPTPQPVVPKGCFEDKDFVFMDEKILSRASKINNENAFWLKLPQEEEILKQKKYFNSKIKTLISKKTKENASWGWKYPETMLTMELYLPHITNPYFVVVLRNPLDVTKSIIKFHELKNNRLNMSFLEILYAVEERNKRMIRFLRKHQEIPKIFISFENIVSNPIKESEKMANFLSLKLTFQKKRKIKKFVIPRNKILKERKKIKIHNLIYKNRLLRFANKCLRRPDKIITFVNQAIKNNLKN